MQIYLVQQLDLYIAKWLTQIIDSISPNIAAFIESSLAVDVNILAKKPSSCGPTSSTANFVSSGVASAVHLISDNWQSWN